MELTREDMVYVDNQANFIMFRVVEPLHDILLKEFESKNILVKAGIEHPCMKGIIRFGVTEDHIMQGIFDFFHGSRKPQEN